MSRPTDYTQDLADQICAELSDGKSLRSVCRQESMPCLKTIFNWLRNKPEFVQQYARAKEETAEALAEDMLEIADDATEDPQRSRLRVDTRKWIASKLKPKKYGEKLAVGGADDLPPVRVGVIKLVSLGDDEKEPT